MIFEDCSVASDGLWYWYVTPHIPTSHHHTITYTPHIPTSHHHLHPSHPHHTITTPHIPTSHHHLPSSLPPSLPPPPIQIITQDISYPHGIAVDYIGNNVYFSQRTDVQERGRLEVATCDGRYRRVLKTGLREAGPLALDITRG